MHFCSLVLAAPSIMLLSGTQELVALELAPLGNSVMAPVVMDYSIEELWSILNQRRVLKIRAGSLVWRLYSKLQRVGKCSSREIGTRCEICVPIELHPKISIVYRK